MPHIRRSSTLQFALFLVMLALPGCATRPYALPAERVDDFTMLVTVYPAAGLDRTTDGRPPAYPAPWLRPARYAVEPDGLLRAESGTGVVDTGFPPIARRLEPHEIDFLYDLAATAGAYADESALVPGPTVFNPPTDRRVAMIETGTNGRFAAAAHDATTDGPLAPLIRELARLSWLDQ